MQACDFFAYYSLDIFNGLLEGEPQSSLCSGKSSKRSLIHRSQAPWTNKQANCDSLKVWDSRLYNIEHKP